MRQDPAHWNRRLDDDRTCQDQDDSQSRRLLDDVLTIFGDAKALWCQTIAERLAGSFPEA